LDIKLELKDFIERVKNTRIETFESEDMIVGQFGNTTIYADKNNPKKILRDSTPMIKMGYFAIGTNDLMPLNKKKRKVK